MANKKNTKFMLDFVQDYLDGKNSRIDWDMDFIHYLIECYPKMEQENSGLADCFDFYFAEDRFEQAQKLSDAEHKGFIRKQFEDFNDALCEI
jgi:hypothetical protein